MKDTRPYVTIHYDPAPGSTQGVHQMDRHPLRNVVGLLLVALLFGCAGPEGEREAGEETPSDPTGADSLAGGPPAWVVTPEGFGALRIGMTLEEASWALGETVEPGEDLASPGCSYATPEALPGGTSLMLIEGQIARADVEAPGILTAEGIGVGADEAEVRRAYGEQLRTQPHKYEEGNYLIYEPPGAEGRHAVIFETDGARVTRYRAGRYPEVGYVEGCS